MARVQAGKTNEAAVRRVWPERRLRGSIPRRIAAEIRHDARFTDDAPVSERAG